MYLIINKDGSIKKAVSEEFIQQGSNNVNFVDFAIEGREISSWTADCVFTLPDETTIRLNGVQQEFTYSGKTYLGYRVYLTSAVLTFSGLIKITARAYNEQGDILYTFPFTQMVNPTMDNNEATPPDISEEQYKSIMALLATYITSYDPHLIRKYDTMKNALNDIANIPTSEHILISNGVNNYEMYYKPTSTSSAFSKVPAPTNWNDIYNYTGLSLNDLSNLSLTTIKGYIDKYDIKEIDTNLLTGIFTTGLTLKDLTTLTSSVDFKTLFYTKNEVYNKTEADSLFIKGEETLVDYLKKTDAAETYLSKENAENTYLSKENASRDYLTKQGASNLYLTDTQIGLKYDTIANVKAKNDAQDTLIENAQSRADAAYNLANSKANTFVFNTYAAMEEDLKSSTKDKYHLGDTLLLKENNTPDYWISAILDTNTGDYGYYEVSELETKIDLSEYQTKVDNTLETTSKTIVGAINENKGVLATKQASVDNSLSTTNKALVGAINEVNQGVSDLDTTKQNKNDNSLSTTSKNIVGAINEVQGITNTLDASKQNKNDNALTTTNKTIVGAINELKSDNETQNANILNKQDKHSVDLATNSKEIVGAINENKESIGTLDTKINTVEGKIPTKNSQLQNDENYIDNTVNNLVNYTTTIVLQENLDTKANKSEIPTKLSTLANDTNFITNEVSNLANYYDKTSVDTKLNLKANRSEIPSKLSQLQNDSEYITKAVNNLENYTTTASLNALLLDKADKSEIPTKVSELINDNEYINKNVNNLTNYTLNSDLNTLLGYKLNVADLPTKVSAFTNDKNYIDKSVDNLEHYTTTTALNTLLNAKADKSEIPTDNLQLANGKNYVAITDFASDSQAGVVKAIPTDETSGLANVYIKNGVLYAKATEVPVLSFNIVNELPTIGENGVIYLVPNTNPETENNYIVYIWIGNNYEELGATQLDLSSYATIEYVDNKISLVNANFDNYYNKTSIDTKLSAKFNISDFTASNIIETIGTNPVQRANKDGEGNTIGTTYATKNELTNKFDKTSFNAQNIIDTLGTNAVNRATKDSKGNTIDATYATKTDVSTALDEKVDNDDFTATAIITKLGDNAVNRATSDSDGNVITSTYATKSEVSSKVNNTDYTAEKIIAKLGTNPVNRSTGDKNGNDIATTYATKNENNSKLNSSDFNATNIIEQLGTNAVNRATSDSLGNNIGDTYATKSALTGKLDNNANAIITTLGNNAVNKANKAVQDENGNNIASTYQKTASIINGTVSTLGNITFSGLVVSDLLNAITNKQRIVFIPSAKTYPAIDLNAQKISDNEYVLKGSFTANVSSKITNYSCVIIATSSSASGTYTNQTANDVDSATLVNLTGAQSISGIKTFTNEIKTNQVASNNDNAMIRYKSTENKVVLGDSTIPTTIMGSGDRPNYSKDSSDFTGNPLALLSDIPSVPEYATLVETLPSA